VAFAFWFVTVATIALLAGRLWWFPPPISELAKRYDDHFVLTLALVGFFFLLAQAALGYIVIRFRDSGGRRAAYWKGNRAWLWAVAAAMILLDISLSRGSSAIWKEQHLTPAPADALRIEVTGQQFAWNVRYPGPDGRWGRTDPALVNDAGGNPLGLDPADPNGRDDIVIPTIVAPVNRTIELRLRSKDVIHSFFVRELRVKQDAVPGMEIPLKFTANKAGRYEVVCAELCGLGHHRMRTYLEVLEPREYEQRLQDYLAQR
jgi:cytochrome c oxidase subunit 2